MRKMETEGFLDFLHLAEKLKCRTRHSWTSSGRRESVAEHSWRLCLAAWLLREEFPEADMDRVLELCLLHDLGEAVTGDVPAFEKNDGHRERERQAVVRAAEVLPEKERQRFQTAMEEFEAGQTIEARLAHGLDKLEAVLSHNEADIATWLPLEYELQMTYGQKETAWHPILRELRRAVQEETREKIRRAGGPSQYGSFYVSSDPGKLSLERVMALMEQSYWAKGRSREMIEGAMNHSLCYGVYREDGYQVGYARVLTDYTTTFYLMDVIIDEAYRGRGLGTMLMDEIMREMDGLHGVLHTSDAQEFYRKYGFIRDEVKQSQVMEKPRSRN